jgi:hypothetical protein
MESSAMPDLNVLLRDYFAITEQERRLDEEKKLLRAAITEEMANRNLKWTRTEQGSARWTTRFKLSPRQEPMLALLNKEDLFPFTHFTPARVKDLLVPKYGRERLIPLFEIEKHDLLVVKRHTADF